MIFTWEWNCILNEKTLSLVSTRGTSINPKKNCCQREAERTDVKQYIDIRYILRTEREKNVA